jgi:hypothetical protein
MRPGVGPVQCDGDDMVSVERYRQYAATCVRQAQDEATSEDKSILLNVALAWLRLAQQVETLQASPPIAPEQISQHELSS